MRGIWRAILAGLAMAVALSACAPRARDIDMGANRYLVTVTGNSFADYGTIEQAFEAASFRSRACARFRFLSCE
jgi:hypothetical protein